MPNPNADKTPHGPIAWMTGNSVAANLLMLLFLVGGLVVGQHIKQEVFPDFTIDQVDISVSYPGASPEEVENGIILAVEEAVRGIEGVDEIRSTASEGSAVISVEALEGSDIDRLWQEVQSEVERITTFPDEAEDPQIVIAGRKREVLQVALFGKTDANTLRRAAEQVRDAMLLTPAITQVDLAGVRDYEIHVEIAQNTLRRFGMTLGDVADTIGRASVELGGGSLKTGAGDILVRVKDRRESAVGYAALPILTEDNGARIQLGDVATVTEGFEDTDELATYEGQPAVKEKGSSRPLSKRKGVKSSLGSFSLKS
jgi:multidrug efflux pump subunit AcrB